VRQRTRRKTTQKIPRKLLDVVQTIDAESENCSIRIGTNAKSAAATEAISRFANRNRVAAGNSATEREPSAATTPLKPAKAAATSPSPRRTSSG
jgi:hypothetical protein